MPKYEASGAEAPWTKAEYVAAQAATHKAHPQMSQILIKF